MKKTIKILLLFGLILSIPITYANLDDDIIYKPDLENLAENQKLPDEVDFENDGFISDGNQGLVSQSDNLYNAIYFGKQARQFHYHAVMEPVIPGTIIIGGLSFKHRIDGHRMDLAITTGGRDKSVLIYAAGMLLADNRNEFLGGLGGLDSFNEFDSITIDLFGDRNYYAVYINETLVIETVLPLEGSGYFGIRSQNSLVRYKDIVIKKLGDKLLGDKPRYYNETFERINLSANKLEAFQGENIDFTIDLEPTGKEYVNVLWEINGEQIVNESQLEMSKKFNDSGVYIIKANVDGIISTIEITINAKETLNENNHKLLYILIAIFIPIIGLGSYLFVRFKFKKAPKI